MIETQAEPTTFPSTAVTLLEQGIAISFNLSPGLSIVASLSDDAIYDIANQMKEARREIKKNMEVVHDIKRNNGKVHS